MSILISFAPPDTSFTLQGFSPTDMHTACFEGKLYLELTDQDLTMPLSQTNLNSRRRWGNFDVQRKEINLTINFYDAKFFFTENIEFGKKVIEFPPQYTIDLSNVTKVFLNRESVDLTIDNGEYVYVLNFYYGDSGEVLQNLYKCFKRLHPTYKFNFTVEKYLIRKKLID